jgi:hypothetical protein
MGEVAPLDSRHGVGGVSRVVKAETLERVVDWIVEKLTVEHWSGPESQAAFAQS